MVSFSDAVDSALKSEYQFTLDGYELLELYYYLLQCSSHFHVLANELLDNFYDRVFAFSTLPFDEVEDGQ